MLGAVDDNLAPPMLGDTLLKIEMDEHSRFVRELEMVGADNASEPIGHPPSSEVGDKSA